MIQMDQIKDRDGTRFGVKYEGRTLENTSCAIEPGVSITTTYTIPENRTYVKQEDGTYKVNTAPYTVTKTYKIGDTAEVGSYNLTYTGTIRKITAKTVTVVEYEDSPGMRKTYRMSLYDFVMRNRDFDADDVAQKNAEMMVTL